MSDTGKALPAPVGKFARHWLICGMRCLVRGGVACARGGFRRHQLAAGRGRHRVTAPGDGELPQWVGVEQVPDGRRVGGLPGVPFLMLCAVAHRSSR